MRKALLGLLAAVLLVPLLAIGSLAIAGLDRFRPWIERMAGSALDRPVTIEGGLELRWWPRPTLVVEGLRLGARPDEREDFARIGRLELRPALGRLLLGRLELDRLLLADATVTLPAGGERAGGGGGPAVSSGREAPAPLPIAREVRLEGVRLRVPAAEGRPSVALLIAVADARLPDPAGPLALEGRGELDGRPLALRLGLDSPLALLERRRVRLEPLSLELAGSDLEGVLELDPGGPRPRLEGKLSSRRLELPLLAALLAGPAAGGEAGASGGTGAGSGPRSGRVIPDAPLDLAGLRGIEASLELRVGELLTGGPVLRELVLPVRIGSGRLRVEPVTAELAGGRIAGRLEADGARPHPSLAGELEVRGVAIGRLQRELAVEPTLEAPLDLDLELSGRGATLAELLASADGELTAVLGAGRVRGAALDRVTGGANAGIRALLGDRGALWVELRCGAFDLPVRSGVAELRVGVLDAARVRITVDGRFDLSSERLDLTLVPRARGTPAVALPVRVRGTLAAVDVTFDQREAARRSALALLGAEAVPPAASARFADLGASDSPCLAGGPPAAEGGSPEVGPGRPGSDALRRGLEGLFGGRR